MELVELAVDLEERFGIRSVNEEFFRARTVADIRDWVVERLPPAPPDSCAPASTFYKLRRHLSDRCGCDVRDVRPKTPLLELFQRNRRKRWQALQEFDSRIPRLDCPQDVASLRRVLALFLLTCTITTFMAFGMTSRWLGIGAGVCSGLLGLLLYCGFERLSTPLEREIPDGLVTVGDLVRLCAPFQMPAGSSRSRQRAVERVTEEICGIVARITDLPIDSIKLESDLIRDLRME